MAQPPQSTDGAAAPFELHPPSIEVVFASGKIESVVPSVQVLATDLTSETEKSAEVEMSGETVKPAAIEKQSQVEGEIDAPQNEESFARMEKSANTEKSTAVEKHSDMEWSERMDKLESETGELILRLDPTGAVSFMCLASPLYAVLAAVLLWLVADQPQALLWTFAHLACFYQFLWIITLSSTGIRIVFFRITYVLLLAFAAVHLFGPINGMIFLYTGMIFVAGMLGYAVAEHFQGAGFEQTANVLCSTPFNSKDCEEQASIMHFCTVLMSLPILARMVWVFLAPYSGHMTPMDVLQVVVELTAEIFAIAVLWILYITQFILRGGLVSMERFVWTAFIGWVACYALAMVLAFCIAEVIGMLVMWLGWMAIGGFFGYTLAVQACYCKMLTRSTESTPTAKEQNGGTVAMPYH